ncbi:DUF3408 domain-containing protein [Myroides odoratus]|uniref:DUF3408 domain-containing protein n=1 Tax=Myroides odoratus TaxID=256 RepID=A0A9Q7E989_MYROD|nr:DUF3408 domain-containing protein [Myroides odoratus]EHQ44301.1 hypothetical protein Myrod_3503 [Myroides odoratus DSM 2801]EKB02596.1 hypothetical protein HMPREF9716_03764 [Myroides odoratus CIP 103059]EKB03001.1 hypothetical protein HMPREF9716_03613 [Myroides odoratus CIP 103059]QQU01576.1 DUF3408 domain-containing protein [Myroides odoratus]WQD56145.1 DUF3408 domain-containing protein [Myroides odoratus]
MEKENKKQQHIDEELMMSLMVDGVRKEGIKEPSQDIEKVEERKTEDTPLKKNSVSKQKKQTKQSVETDYESIFFKKSDTNARDGKTVYIRPEFHEKLTRIIHIIGEDKITIYAYLDNLLDNHFDEFAQQITKSYNEKYKPI